MESCRFWLVPLKSRLENEITGFNVLDGRGGFDSTAIIARRCFFLSGLFLLPRQILQWCNQSRLGALVVASFRAPLHYSSRVFVFIDYSSFAVSFLYPYLCCGFFFAELYTCLTILAGLGTQFDPLEWCNLMWCDHNFYGIHIICSYQLRKDLLLPRITWQSDQPSIVYFL